MNTVVCGTGAVSFFVAGNSLRHEFLGLHSQQKCPRLKQETQLVPSVPHILNDSVLASGGSSMTGL